MNKLQGKSAAVRATISSTTIAIVSGTLSGKEKSEKIEGGKLLGEIVKNRGKYGEIRGDCATIKPKCLRAV